MKIGIDAYHALFYESGVGRYTRSLVKELLAFPEIEEITLFYNFFRNVPKQIWKPNSEKTKVVVFRCPKGILQSCWNVFGVPRIESLIGNVDVFHGHHFILPPMAHAKTVLTVHDLTYLKFPHYYYNQKLNKKGYQQELPNSLKRADHVITISETTKKDLIEVLNYPANKISPIYLGAEQIFSPDVSDEGITNVLTMYNIRSSYLIFLVGANEPRKNIARTITAFQQAREIIKEDISLLIIGDGIKERVKGKTGPEIIFLGNVPKEELPILLKGAVMSLYPSLYEGFGLPVLESMACGTPVITSNISSMPEVGGDAVSYVNPFKENEITEAIVNLYRNTERRKRLSEMGKERAKKFTWQRTAEKTIEVYKKILEL